MTLWAAADFPNDNNVKISKNIRLKRKTPLRQKQERCRAKLQKNISSREETMHLCVLAFKVFSHFAKCCGFKLANALFGQA
jgi:hypothetical protein